MGQSSTGSLPHDGYGYGPHGSTWCTGSGPEGAAIELACVLSMLSMSTRLTEEPAEDATRGVPLLLERLAGGEAGVSCC
jgi:hypothetical protein